MRLHLAHTRPQDPAINDAAPHPALTPAAREAQVTISFCPECRSGELPPATFRALYKQRLRWALGWDQVRALPLRMHHAESTCQALAGGCVIVA